MTVELILLIGLQASGKSSFCRSRLASTHSWVSKDNFRNNRNPARRQRQLITAALGDGRSVVVDNTNAMIEERAELIELGRSFGATVVGYYIESQLEVCLERNRQRTGKARVPDLALFATEPQCFPWSPKTHCILAICHKSVARNRLWRNWPLP